MPMPKSLLALILFALIVPAARAETPATTQPASSTAEVRATSAFNRGDYAIALPLFQKVAEEARSSGDADKLARVQEQIRVCKAEMVAQAAAAVPPAAQGEPVAPAEPTGPRKPHDAPKPGETREMLIKELGNFDYDADKGGTIPDDVKGLNGAKLRLRGFMIPMDQAENVTQFALVPDLFACCFGQPPQVQHMVVANAPKGKAVNYYPDELVVEGTLKVEEKKEDGFIVSLFEMDVTSVKPAPK
jgi:hypothetical protein